MTETSARPGELRIITEGVPLLNRIGSPAGDRRTHERTGRSPLSIDLT